MLITKQSFAVARHCPVVGHSVSITGVQMIVADARPETVKKTCFKFQQCYKDRAGDAATGNIVPMDGCLLGHSDI